MKISEVKKALKDAGYPTIANVLNPKEAYTKEGFIKKYLFTETSKAKNVGLGISAEANLDDVAFTFINSYGQLSEEHGATIKVATISVTGIANITKSKLDNVILDGVTAPKPVLESLDTDKYFEYLTSRGLDIKLLQDDENTNRWAILFIFGGVKTLDTNRLADLWDNFLDTTTEPLTKEDTDFLISQHHILVNQLALAPKLLDIDNEFVKNANKWSERLGLMLAQQ